LNLKKQNPTTLLKKNLVFVGVARVNNKSIDHTRHTIGKQKCQGVVVLYHLPIYRPSCGIVERCFFLFFLKIAIL